MNNNNQPIVIRPEDVAGQYDYSGKRIPRPMNAFMLFANDTRQELKSKLPTASNKEISVRLGQMWSTLPSAEKDIFYRKAKMGEREHMAKYPDYRYCPTMSKVIKAMRKQEVEQRKNWLRSHAAIEKACQQQGSDIIPAGKRKQILSAISSTQETSKSQYHIQKPGLDPVYKCLEGGTETPYMVPAPRSQAQRGRPRNSGHTVHRPTPVMPSQHRYTLHNDQVMYMPHLVQDGDMQTDSPTDHQTDSGSNGTTRQADETRPAFSDTEEELAKQAHPNFDEQVLFSDPSLYDSECRQAVESISATENEFQFDERPTNGSSSLVPESDMSSGLTGPETGDRNQSDTDYVMIPCDINVARMLGWPVHLLQRVSNSVFESLRGAPLEGSESESIESIFPGLGQVHMEDPQPSSPNMGYQKVSNGTNASAVEVKTEHMEHDYDPSDGNLAHDHHELNAERVSRTTSPDDAKKKFPSEIPGDLGLCPMDNDFSVFQSSESSGDELDNIDTSSMSETFGHLDSSSMAAYQRNPLTSPQVQPGKCC